MKNFVKPFIMAFASVERFNKRLLTYSELTAKRDQAVVTTIIFGIPAMSVVLWGLYCMFEPFL